MPVTRSTSTTHSSLPLARLHAPQKADVEITTAEVEEAFDHLFKQLTFTNPIVLDYKDDSFKERLHSLILDSKSSNASHSQKWESPNLLYETKSIMVKCQALLYKIDGILNVQTQHLHANPQERLQKKAELLKDENFAHHQPFRTAFDLFIKAYHLVRSKAFILSLPNIKNFPKEKFESFLLSDLTHEYCMRFMKGNTPQREMNILFNDTQEQLADLLKTAYPHSPHLIKDEKHTPGDYDNPTNPFWILPRKTQTK
jgi:hypothetical protein